MFQARELKLHAQFLDWKQHTIQQRNQLENTGLCFWLGRYPRFERLAPKLNFPNQYFAHWLQKLYNRWLFNPFVVKSEKKISKKTTERASEKRLLVLQLFNEFFHSECSILQCLKRQIRTITITPNTNGEPRIVPSNQQNRCTPYSSTPKSL